MNTAPRTRPGCTCRTWRRGGASPRRRWWTGVWWSAAGTRSAKMISSLVLLCYKLHNNNQVSGPTDSVEVVGGGLAGCAWGHGELRLPRPRSGHCLVRVGGQLVAVGGGPDSYGSTQVRGEPRDGHHAQHAGVQPRHPHLAGRPASAEGPRAARLQQAWRGRRGGRG